MKLAHDLARGGGMSGQVVDAGPFSFQAFYRPATQAGSLRVYIEGDGFAWISRRRVSPDPTPRDPVALRLAVADRRGGVLYVARPCQYVGVGTNRRCHPRYWTSHRFAPEVIEATGNVIDQVKKAVNARTVELIGFSGGGAVAVLVAARHSDVVSIRTVAGNLDHVTLNRRKKVTPLTGSLNAADVAAKVSGIPQIHYVGSDDEFVGGYVAESYRNRAGGTECIAIRRVPGASHTGGWDDLWRDLVELPLPICN